MEEEFIVRRDVIPQRPHTVTASSYYDFLKTLSRYAFINISRDALLENPNIYANYEEASRKDRIKAHLDAAVSSGILNSVNSHYEFPDDAEIHELMDAMKEGIASREKVAFGKFIRNVPLALHFFKEFGEKEKVPLDDVTGFIRKYYDFEEGSSYRRAARFFANILKKAGLIYRYRTKKRLLEINPKFKTKRPKHLSKHLIGQKTLEVIQGGQLQFKKDTVSEKVASSEYKAVITLGDGNTLTYKVPLHSFGKVIAFLEKIDEDRT